METFDIFVNWLTEHEAALSAFAALVVIVGVTLSPMGAGLRAAISRRPVDADNKKQSLDSKAVISSSVTDSSETGESGQDSGTLIPNRFSVAVLPFENMSDDKEQEYLADGLTEDIITGLSLDSRLFVIARNSTYAYKGQSPDIREVGNELGVRYVVEGSLRRIGERLRITAQLIETLSGSHVWADQVERPFSEFFEAQDEITSIIVTALCSQLNIAERARYKLQQPESLEAWQLCVRAETGYMAGAANKKAVEECISLARQATEIEPEYARAWALLGILQAMNYSLGGSQTPETDIKSALESAARGLALSPSDPIVIALRGLALLRTGRVEESMAPLRHSLERNPNYALARANLGGALIFSGKPQEGLAELDRFLRQNPRDPSAYIAYLIRARAYDMLGDHKTAEAEARTSIEHYSGFAHSWAVLASILYAQGRESEAREAMAEMILLEPGFTLEFMEEWTKRQFLPEYSDRFNACMGAIWPD